MNPAAEGTVYPEITFVVDPEQVAAFRAVFGQTEGVPPTFVSVAEFLVIPTVVGRPDPRARTSPVWSTASRSTPSSGRCAMGKP